MPERRSLRALLLAVALAALLLVGVATAGGAARAQERRLVLERFDTTAVVRSDGEVAVAETITARFEGGPWQGLQRSIPVQDPGRLGGTLSLGLRWQDAREVSEGNEGPPLRTEARGKGDERELRVYVPAAAGTTRTLRLRYRLRHGLRFFPDHDEFYWNVTGNDRPIPIDRAGAVIELPPGSTGVRALAYTGPLGSRRSDASVGVEGSVVRVRTTRPLAANEGLTVAVAFDRGVVRRPSLPARALHWLSSNPITLLPLLTGGLLYLRWRQVGRDPAGRPIVVAYEPPPELSPAEVGALVDERVDDRDALATLVDLAVRGYVRILPQANGTDYRFRLLRSEAEWGDLRDHERLMLEGLFPAGAEGASTSTAALENRFHTTLRRIRQAIENSLVQRGCYRRWPMDVRIGWWGLAFVLAWASPFLVALLGWWLGPGSALPFLALVATALTIAVAGWFMPARTERGARLRERVLGFQRFVERVEADRFERLVRTPELFERYLPHAMAFGLTHRWVKAFADLLTRPPAWYGGGGDLGGMDRFGRDLDRFGSRTAAAMSSAPRSSSGSSGFGGGGFSGGGSGGGSVGGF